MNYRSKLKRLTIILSVLSIFLFAFTYQQNPTLYIIGDSTVKNSNKEQWGWGTLIGNYFDSNKISVSNQAMAGRSTRTFIKEGRWDKVLSTLKEGDFVMIQFGHNEGSKPDTSRRGYRGVLRGIEEDTVQLIWPDGTLEIVHTYGWYIKKFIIDVKAMGASPIVLSMIPRNEFREGKVQRANNNYGKWAMEVAKQEGAYFIDLNGITADKYDKLGPDETKKFFPGDHTHTNKDGADVNAQSVVEGLKMQKKIPLNKFLINP
ncbi:MAG: rhamnogalacturonan acetylesterase [Ginsengibacter sp.]